MKQFALIWLCAFPFITQAQNIPEFFGADYDYAVGYIRERKAVFEQFAETYCPHDTTPTTAKLMAALVFPEIVRYSRLSDFFETAALELAYVQGGREVANFSIGKFQMRPSFIEDLDSVLVAYSIKECFSIKGSSFSKRKSVDKRRTILNNLKSFTWQMFYLCVFVRIADLKFSELTFNSDSDKVHFYASFYNYGLSGTEQKIGKWSKKKAFPMGSSFDGKQYAYADVALWFWEHEAVGIFSR